MRRRTSPAHPAGTPQAASPYEDHPATPAAAVPGRQDETTQRAHIGMTLTAPAGARTSLLDGTDRGVPPWIE